MYFVYLNRILKWGVALLPIFFPFYLIKVQLHGVPFTFLELLVYILFSLFLIKEFYDWRREGFGNVVLTWIKFKWISKYRIISSEFWFGLSLFFLAATFSLFSSSNLMLSLGIWKGWILMPILYFIMLRRVVLIEPGFLQISLRSYLSSSMFLAIIALYQVVFGDYITLDERASGPFESANYLSLYLGPALIYGLTNVWESIKYYLKDWRSIDWFNLLATFLIGLGLLFSKSYASFLALILGISFYLLVKEGSSLWTKYKKYLLIVCLLGLVLGSGFIWTQKDTWKFKSFFKPNWDSSTGVRLQIWKTAWGGIMDDPIKGIGLGDFQEFYTVNAERILGQKPFREEALHPHNLFLTHWLYTGALGLFSLVWILGVCFFRLRRSLTGKRRRMVVLGLAMLLMLIVHGFFDVPFWKNDLAMIFWLIVSIL